MGGTAGQANFEQARKPHTLVAEQARLYVLRTRRVKGRFTL